MAPTIGRIVIFNTTEDHRKEMENDNRCNIQEQLPATIVAVWSDDCVNLKVQMDGYVKDMWITSAIKGDCEGQWNWPKRE